MSENDGVVVPQWVFDAADTIDDMLADNKKVVFKTHKNRKSFSAKIRSLIIEGFLQDRNPVQKALEITNHKNCVTHIHSEKPKGFAVMTDVLSTAGDVLLGVGPSVDLAQKAKIAQDEKVMHTIHESKKGVRNW